jgi:hypothetical protein
LALSYDHLDRIIDQSPIPGIGAVGEIHINPELRIYDPTGHGRELICDIALDKPYRGHRLVLDPSASYAHQVVRPVQGYRICQ